MEDTHAQGHKENCKAYYKANKESVLRRVHAYNDAHRDQINAKAREWHSDHREERNAYNRKYRSEHLEELRAKAKAYRNAHREERNAKSREWHNNNQERMLAYRISRTRKTKDLRLKRLYGISLEVWEDLFTLQNGQCPICNKKFTKSGNHRAVIDHDHGEAGHVRSLICAACNAAEGLLVSPDTVLSLYKYIMNNELLSYQKGIMAK